MITLDESNRHCNRQSNELRYKKQSKIIHTNKSHIISSKENGQAANKSKHSLPIHIQPPEQSVSRQKCIPPEPPSFTEFYLEVSAENLPGTFPLERF